MICPAAGTDCREIEEIARQAYTIYVPRMDREPFPMLDDYAAHIHAGHAFVLKDHAGIQGYLILLMQENGELLLDNVAVRPAAHGKGYGRALIEFALTHAKAHGAKKVVLYTNEAMVENLAFYPHLGFTETHRAMQNGYRRVFFVRLVQ